MPYEIKRLPHSHLVKMINSNTGRVLAKHTTRKKAEAQIRVIESVAHGSVKYKKNK